MLLQRFLACDRIKEELAPFLVFRISRRVTDVLSHVVPPFFIELCKPLELLLKVSIILRSFLGLESANFFFKDGISLEFLLHDILQLQRWSLKNLKALLQLRRKHLLHCQILELMNPWASHTGESLISPSRYFKRRGGELQGSILVLGRPRLRLLITMVSEVELSIE